MKNFTHIISRTLCASLAIVLLFVAASCGGKKSYKIEGTVEGLGTQNITVIYYDGEALRQTTTTAVDSKFQLEGSVPQPVVMEFYDNQRTRLGCLVIENGDEVAVTYKVNAPTDIAVKGNKLSEELATFLSANGKSLNTAIEKRIAELPEDNLTALLASYYYDITVNPARADSLLATLIAPDNFLPFNYGKQEHAHRLKAVENKLEDMRIYSRDSLTTFSPSKDKNTLYIFTDSYTIPDSITHFADSVVKEMRVAVIRLSMDTFGWRREAARFDKNVEHLWAVGGISNPELRQFDLPRVPYFIVTDTASLQTYRSSSLPK